VDTETNEFTSIMMGYYSTGLLDPLFATNGTYSSDTYVAEKLFLDPFDRILAGGFYSESGESDVAVWRFDSDGTFQSGFGSSGYLVEMASVSDSVSVTMDSSNRILMAGSACAEMTGGECASFDMAIWAYR